MDTVKVSKEELIKVLRTNRDSHKQIYKDAVEGFLVETGKKLESALKKVRERKTITSISFVRPIDHTKDYDRVISMLEMSVDKEISLKQYEYNQYVLDEWISEQERTLLRGYAMSSSNASNY